MAEAGVETAADLRSLPAEDLLAAVRRATPTSAGFGQGPRFGPIAYGAVIPRDPFFPAAPEQSADIPLLIGYNMDEMTLFLAAQP